MKETLNFLKCLFGFGSVVDGSICRASKGCIDFHDYHVYKGGDGHPSHFYNYKCHKCGKVFSI